MQNATFQDVIEGRATHHVACERAEAFIDRLPDGCVSLMTLDFPYYGVKDDAWDNAWESPDAFIAWMGGILAQCRRVLAPNGSIYVFAAPQVRGGLTMATRVECEVARHFSVLQRITWQKPEGSTKAEMFDKDTCRSFFPASEVIIFAEQPVDAAVEYLRAECAAAGLTPEQLSGVLGFKETSGSIAPRRYLAISGFAPMSRADYAKLQVRTGRFARPYDALYRSFNVSAEVPYTDVWTYRTVNTYAGKHPCEKPPEMARDMVRASSREGGLVADFFCGSGAFLAAAVAEGRRAIGCDMDPHWAEQAQRRCDAAKVTGRVVRTAPKPKDDRQGRLW